MTFSGEGWAMGHRIPISVEDLFDCALVINRDQERGRLRLMGRAFSREGLPMPRRVGAVDLRRLQNNKWWRCFRNRYYAANCAASHVMCIRMAEALGWPFVAIFEDDAWPQRGCRAALERTLAEVPADRGVVRMGCHAYDDGRRVGNHAYIVFADAYQAVLGAYRANIRCYCADMVFTLHPPLAAVTTYVEGLFTQCNRVGDTWRYLPTHGAEPWQGMPPEGFPTAEEVLA